MSHPSSAGQPSWRGSEPSGESSRSLGPRWRSQPESVPRARRARWPWGRITLTLLAFSTVCALFIWVTLWLRPAKDTSLVVLGAAYEENLAVPHNVYGWNVLHNLAKYAQEQTSQSWDAGRVQLFGKPREIKTTGDWDGEFKKALRSFPGKTLFLYTSLHGGADRKGAYLLPQMAFTDIDADASLDRDKIRLEDILTLLETNRVAVDRNVVLILDATQMAENWALGMLTNDFARALDKLNTRIEKIPNLVVVSASGLDQRSWASEDWYETVFGHYLIEGLKGVPDDTDSQGRVNLLDLFRYVKRNVEDWARVHRDAEQTPVLYPLDEVGRERARKIHVTIAEAQSQDRPPSKPFVTPLELSQAWTRHSELLQLTPRPAVYTPHLWRVYQDWLLRYEQLIYAKSTNTANVLQRLRELDQAMVLSQRQDLSTERNTLALFAATGRTIASSEPAVRAVNRLWETPPKEQVRVWQEIQTQNGDAAIPLLRLQMMELLYDRAADDPGIHLDRAYQLLTLIDDSLLEDPLKVRPAEVHFLMMLRRDLPGLGVLPALSRSKSVPVRLVSQNTAKPQGLSADLVRLALKVRIQAERAALGVLGAPLEGNLVGVDARYPYSEQVAPWIQPLVDDGDRLRRRGQDLLFAGDPASWERAEKALMEARQQYTQAQKTAHWVRKALATRDTVLPMLPYGARWLAERRLTPEGRLSDPALVPEKFEKLCLDVHVLLDLLAQPSTDRARDAAQQADVVMRQFEEIEAGGRQLRRNLDDDQISLPTVWRELDAALTVPFANVEVRRILLEQKSRLGSRFRPIDGTPPTPVDRKDRLETAKERARRHGRMNLALLGPRWFDECGGDLESFDKVRRRLEVFDVEERWWESIAVAGEEIGQRWQRLPREIGRLVDTAAKSLPDAAAPILASADRLQRSVDSPGQQVASKNAAGRFRQSSLENLMLVQARRAWQDHWFADDPAKEPYFRRAGLGFLRDAETLARFAFSSADPRLAELTKKLTEPSDLRVDLLSAPGQTTPARVGPRSAPVHITTESNFALQYRMTTPNKEDFAGFPLLWVETGPGLQLDSPRIEGRLVEEFRDRSDRSLAFRLSSPALEEAESKQPLSPLPIDTGFTLRGYYRGQFFAWTTPIQLHPLPRTQFADHLLPVRSSVAVRASKDIHQQFGQGSGALVLILDCSGSMGPGANQEYTKTTKFVEATEAIRTMLQKVPKGTQVSLWAFGQAVGEGRTVERAEDTIQSIVAPTTWDPADPALLRGVMERISYPAIIPWNESPILRTMVSARQDLQSATGFKTMVVITDGMDNRYDKDTDLNPKKLDPRTFLRETFPDIEINIIGFKIVSKEEEAARKQFQVVEELPIPGRVYLAQESRELAATLEKVLRQKLRYWVDREDDRPVAGFGGYGLDVGTDSASDQWLPGGLLPGAFKVRVHTNKRLTKSIALNQSDLLLVDLVPSKVPGAPPGSLDFERSIYSQSDFPWKPAREKGNWRFAALQNQFVNQRGLQMLATLERKNDPLATTLQQVVPAKAWIEVSPPPDLKMPLHQRWHYQPGYPAPAWGLDLPLWPARSESKTPVRPTVRAWWSLEEPLPSAIVERGHDFKQPTDLVERSLRIAEEEVTLESVQVEDHLVETEPARRDQPARREWKTCLVVRMRHAPGSAVWARAPGLNTAGSEHRFFSDVGKYTGLFWPVTRDQVNLSLNKLEFIALAQFKRLAEQRNFFIELDNLYEPQPNDTRPLQPLDLAQGQSRDPRPVDQAPPLLPPPPAILPIPREVPNKENLPARPEALVPTMLPGLELPLARPLPSLIMPAPPGPPLQATQAPRSLLTPKPSP